MEVSSSAKAALLLSGAVLFGVVVSIGADRAFGAFKYGGLGSEGLLFSPGSHAVYSAADFSFVSNINSLGFRDREFSPFRGKATRILALGDSYTYGWGVEVDQSWPKVVEARLRRDGLDVEVANLGKPGASPVDYADAAEQAIPLLKPDLVIIAVLEGDDLAQMRSAHIPKSRLPKGTSAGLSLWKLAHLAYPNFLRMARWIRAQHDTVFVAEEWRRQGREILSKLTPEQRQHYDGLDPRIRAAFERGGLNPPLILAGLASPNYWEDTIDPNTPEVRRLVDELSRQLARIGSVAGRYGAEVLVVSMPMGHYVDHQTYQQRLAYGFRLEERMLTSDAGEREILRAAEAAAIPYLNVTPQFRAHAGEGLFFRLDTHLNARGHALFAEEIVPVVARNLTVAGKTSAGAQP